MEEENLKLKILRVYEQNNSLNIIVETIYGEEKYGLALNKKFIDPETNKPKWMREVRQILEKKYGTAETKIKKDLPEADAILDKEISLDELSPNPITVTKKVSEIFKKSDKTRNTL